MAIARAGCCTPLLYSPVFRCSVVAVAAAGLLLPEGFSRCCPQPGYRSGCDQDGPGDHPRPAPLHGPGRPQDIEHDDVAVTGDREHRQPPRVAQAPRHADDHPRYRGNDPDGPEEPVDPAGCGCLRPGGSRGLCARLAHQVKLLPDVLLHLGRGRRFRAKAPRNQPEAGSACPLCQGPLPASSGPVPGPGGGLGNDGGDSLQPPGRPRGPGPVQKRQKGHPQHLGPAFITSHPGIVAQAARMCQAPGLPLPRRCRPAGAGRRRRSGPAASALAPRRSPAQPGSPGRAAGPMSPPAPPCGSTPHRRLKLDPGDPIHYEFNLGSVTATI